MSAAIILTMTDAGRLSMLNYRESGFNIEFSHVGLGSGNFTHNTKTVGMVQKWADLPLINGFVDTVNHCLILTAMGQLSEVKKVSEIGVFDQNGNLFAIVAKPSGYFFQSEAGGFFSFNVSIALDEKIEGQKINLSFAQQEQLLQALLSLHLQHVDPHPQYKKFITDIFNAHINEPDPHKQYVMQSTVVAKINDYIDQVRRLKELFLTFFGKFIYMGYLKASTYMTIEVEGLQGSLKSNEHAILMNPEGPHEGWRITRNEGNFLTHVYNRSGTERIGFNGALDWLVMSDASNSIIAGVSFPELLAVGVVQSKGSVQVDKPANKAINFKNAVFLMTPEGANEGWTVARETNRLLVSIFNRSGTSRDAGYNGLVSYAVFEPKDGKDFKPTTFPCMLMAGVSDNGTFSITRPAGQTWDFKDPNIVLLITPDGGHEAWNITRYQDRIDINVYSRSGTRRIGYVGKVNWAVFKKA